jgi:hypothetical protein
MIERRFLRSLVRETQRRADILEAICKRLTLTQREASSDAGLHDEPVRGKHGVRRFRVTGGARIHYRYGGGGEMVFEDYFPEGQHDRGLS